jgi:hypothetical protein
MRVSWVWVLAAVTSPALAQVDSFGIRQRHPTLPGSLEWNSQHWASGGARALSGRDAVDPTGFSARRGNGTVTIDGAGQLRLGGTQPRLYINSYPDGSDDASEATQRYRNIEVSVYFRRLSTAGAPYGGLVIGVRSGPLGHGSAGGDDCDATTYYAQLRNDGRWGFVKELRHPDAFGRHSSGSIWPGNGGLPVGAWVGLRYAALTRDDGSVVLELWLDRVGTGVDGGSWELLGTTIDDGSWAASATGCAYAANRIIDPGSGVVLLRNTSESEAGELSEYRWLSVREIDAGARQFHDGFE